MDRRWILLVMASLGGLLLAGGLFYASEKMAQKIMPDPFPALSEMDFTLQAGNDQMLKGADLAGQARAIFFGFTHCPDVCPLTLYRLSQAAAAIDPDGTRLGIVLITVDPARDTPELMTDYTSDFGPAVIGLSGRPAEIEKAMAAFGIYAKKVPLEGDDYTMDHTASVFLYDSSGRFFGTIDFAEPEEISQQKLARLVGR